MEALRMKASTLLTTLKSRIASTECQTDILTEKYGEFKEKYMEEAADLLENYGSILADPIIQAMTDVEKEKLRETIIAVIPLDSVNARYKANDNEYLIVLNERLLALIYAWGELQLLPMFCPDEVPKNFARLFAPVIDCYLTPNSGNTLPIFSYSRYLCTGDVCNPAMVSGFFVSILPAVILLLLSFSAVVSLRQDQKSQQLQDGREQSRNIGQRCRFQHFGSSLQFAVNQQCVSFQNFQRPAGRVEFHRQRNELEQHNEGEQKDADPCQIHPAEDQSDQNHRP